MTDASSRRRLLLFFVASTCAVAVLSPSRADDKDDKKLAVPPVLRWGADFSGGEPYVIGKPGPDTSGLEGDLATYLAKKLGSKCQSVNGEWDKLPLELLNRRSIDLVLNGYEWSAEREKIMLSTIPYYSYRLDLIVKKGSPIQDWGDLKAKMKVGVLTDSAADRYLSDKERFPGVDVVRLGDEGTTGAMTRVVSGALDATVQDDPVFAWYVKEKKLFPTLRTVGDPVAPGDHPYYVIFVRPEDKELRDRLNDAIRAGLSDGSLRRIYAKYRTWPDKEGELLEAAKVWPPTEPEQDGAKEDTLIEQLRALGPKLWAIAKDLAFAAITTVLLTLCAMPLAMLAGLLIALGRLYGPKLLAVPLGVYVEVIRGTPVLFQLLIIYFFLPELGVKIPAFWSGVLGLAINYSAYEAENYRAGLLAIPEGQTEAALALGMTRVTALRRVIVPQATRLVIPPVTNDFISLFKDTSICSAISVTELMARYRSNTVNMPGMMLYTLLITGCLYLLMSYPLSLLARRLEARREEEEDAAA